MSAFAGLEFGSARVVSVVEVSSKVEETIVVLVVGCYISIFEILASEGLEAPLSVGLFSAS